jgi:hypothetical protein
LLSVKRIFIAQMICSALLTGRQDLRWPLRPGHRLSSETLAVRMKFGRRGLDLMACPRP